ncbi:MAG: DUF3145 domain-containing protein [Actinomycetota bacterium]|nr:DUF3145 domain-containing protein [Actinomycetota bacterium]
MATRGVLYVHSCPAAVCPHVEWAVSRVLGVAVRLQWTAQPADPTTQRAESIWHSSAGTAGRLASGLRQWPMIRFEVTEDPSAGADGERIAYVPGRGAFRSAVSANGDLVVGEDRLRALLATAADPQALAHGVERLLGTEWDADLEPYRQGGDGAPVTWLYAG